MSEIVESRALIGASNLITTPLEALKFSRQDYLNLLAKGGFDESAGIEWTPTRFPGAVGAGRELAKIGMVTSLSESWREHTFRTMIQDVGETGIKGFIAATQIGVAFPLLDRSYEGLDKLQQLHRRKLPLIIHPEGQHLDNQSPRRPRQTVPEATFAELWFQPTAEWARNNDIPLDSRDAIETVGAIEAVMAEQGIQGVVIDLHHILSERDGAAFRSQIRLVEALGRSPTFREVQVAIRPDFGGKTEDLRLAALGKLYQTRTGDALVALNQGVPKDKKIKVVSEIAASAIAKLKRPYLEVHRTINDSVRDILR
jgi:hypothetical protein